MALDQRDFHSSSETGVANSAGTTSLSICTGMGYEVLRNYEQEVMKLSAKFEANNGNTKWKNATTLELRLMYPK
jgi:hypothetical protein